MKMDSTLLNEINAQINREFYAAYLYFAMSTYFTEISLDGFAKLTKDHAKEELTHAKRIYDYLVLRDEKITLLKIDSPETNWVNPTDAIKAALDHEKFVSGEIYKLYRMSKEQNDYPLEVFLQWFINEQVEEEHLFQTMLDKMGYAEDCTCEVMNLDRELKQGEEA